MVSSCDRERKIQIICCVIEDEKKKKKAAPKPKKRQDYDDYDDYDDVYDDEPMSKAPIIILAIAIVVVAGVIAYMLLK